MLKVRVIPTLLWKDVGLVKGVGFDSWRRVGTVLPSIKVYNTREVDELILLDVTATAQNREPDYEAISTLSSECFVPLTFGGGIKNVATIREILKSGPDKVAINSAAYDSINLISEAADLFGAQCIVGSIDFKKEADGSYQCYRNSGKNPTGKNPVEWAMALEAAGCGEILITSIERDGAMVGYDVDLIKSVSESVSVPVIASGGAGNFEHMYQAITSGGANAVAAASIFHFTEMTPLEAKSYLASKGVPVRDSQSRIHSSVNVKAG